LARRATRRILARCLELAFERGDCLSPKFMKRFAGHAIRELAVGAHLRACVHDQEGMMSRKRPPTDDRTAANKWQTHPFERREDWRPREEKDAITHTLMVLDKDRLRAREVDFERLLDLLMKDFKIDDRATLKSHIEVATRIYNHNPDVLSDRDRQRLVKFAPKVAGLLRKNAIPIENIITDFDQQHVRGFEPEFCKSIYDQGEADAFMTRIWQASHTLMELAGVLSQHHPRGRPPDAGLHGAMTLLGNYWERELGRNLKSHPWKRGFASFLRVVFEFIDPIAIDKLPSAAKRRVRALDKKSR
jgi:hypothetical protein